MNTKDYAIFLLVGLATLQSLLILYIRYVAVGRIVAHAVATARAEQAVATAQAVHDRVVERWAEIKQLSD